MHKDFSVRLRPQDAKASDAAPVNYDAHVEATRRLGLAYLRRRLWLPVPVFSLKCCLDLQSCLLCRLQGLLASHCQHISLIAGRCTSWGQRLQSQIARVQFEGVLLQAGICVMAARGIMLLHLQLWLLVLQLQLLVGRWRRWLLWLPRWRGFPPPSVVVAGRPLPRRGRQSLGRSASGLQQPLL